MTLDILSALDESFLRLETPSAHMHIGWTLVLQGEPPSVPELRRHVAGRLDLLPRFRRRVLSSRLRLHDPMWIDDPDFDIAQHILGVRVRAGGGAAELRELAGELLCHPLDHQRPLWRLHLVRGLDGNRFAMVGQVHHAVTDGLAAMAMATLLLDNQPAARAVSVRRFDPSPPPGFVQRATASAEERLQLSRSAAGFGLGCIVNPGAVGEALGALQRLGGALRAIGTRAPGTTLNRPLGPRRSVAFTRLPLAAARELGRRRGATVDDVVLATATLALGRYLRRVEGCHPWLRVLVPVNTRTGAADELGNQVSAMFVELPIGERDPGIVLSEVTRQTGRLKRAEHAGTIDAMLRASRLAPAPVRDVIAWLLTRPQAFNAVLSNVRGPTEPLYVLGRRVQSAYPAVPLAQGHGLSVGVLSYCGSLHVGLYADPDIVPDLPAVARDFTSAFDALRLAIDPRAPRPPGRRRRREPRPGSRPVGAAR